MACETDPSGALPYLSGGSRLIYRPIIRYAIPGRYLLEGRHFGRIHPRDPVPSKLPIQNNRRQEPFGK